MLKNLNHFESPFQSSTQYFEDYHLQNNLELQSNHDFQKQKISEEIHAQQDQKQFPTLKHKTITKQKQTPNYWSSSEDAKLISIIQQLGPFKWAYISQFIPNRTRKQCRQRWFDHLDPKISKATWNESEEWILFLANKYIPNQWSKIANYLPGRNDNNILNRWKNIQNKNIPLFVERFQSLLKGKIINYKVDKDYANTEKTLLQQLKLNIFNSDEVISDNISEPSTQATNLRKISSKSLEQSLCSQGLFKSQCFNFEVFELLKKQQQAYKQAGWKYIEVNKEQFQNIIVQ